MNSQSEGVAAAVGIKPLTFFCCSMDRPISLFLLWCLPVRDSHQSRQEVHSNCKIKKDIINNMEWVFILKVTSPVQVPVWSFAKNIIQKCKCQEWQKIKRCIWKIRPGSFKYRVLVWVQNLICSHTLKNTKNLIKNVQNSITMKAIWPHLHGCCIQTLLSTL